MDLNYVEQYPVMRGMPLKFANGKEQVTVVYESSHATAIQEKWKLGATQTAVCEPRAVSN